MNDIVTVIVLVILCAISICIRPRRVAYHDVSQRQPYIPPNLTIYEYFHQITTIHEPIGLCRPSSMENLSAVKIIGNDESETRPKEPLSLLILVASGANHFHARREIRATWGNLTKFEEYSHEPYRLQVIFSLGAPTEFQRPITTQRKIDEETKQYNDILQGSFLDSYYNLTVKQIASFKWIKKCCPKGLYILKSDDDVYINVYNLINLIIRERINDTDDDLLIGNTDHRYFKPSRKQNNKCYCPYQMCPFDRYPTFAVGPGYLMSFGTLSKLYDAAQSLQLFPFEDVFLTGICASKAKIERRHNPLFILDRNYSTDVCTYAQYIVCELNHTSEVRHLTPVQTMTHLAKCNRM